MERERGSKIIAIVALFVGVIGLTIGFAALGSTLTIKSSATYTPDASTFDVNFSTTQNTTDTEGSVTVAATPNTVKYGTASIDNSTDPVISGLSAEFTKPGDKVEYTFYARNDGAITAYLRSITIGQATGASNNATIHCTGSDVSNLSTICSGLTYSVKVGTESATTTSVPTITNHSLAVNAGEAVVVTIEYPSSVTAADGEFTVALGDITLSYSSVDGN